MFTDVNECSEANNCQQDCVNTPGSFECTCGVGFTLDANGITCTGKCYYTSYNNNYKSIISIIIISIILMILLFYCSLMFGGSFICAFF